MAHVGPTRDTFLLVAFPVCFLDRWTKGLAMTHLDPDAAGTDGVGLALRLRFNPSGFEGALASIRDVEVPVMVIVVAVLYLALFWTRVQWPRHAIPVAMILGGGLGNLLDLIHLGAGVDFIQAAFGNGRGFTFNLADVAIASGLVASQIVWLRRPRARA